MAVTAQESAMEDSSPMAANAQEFCLRWNNFHQSLVSALDGFKNDQDFVDVTLACEGQFLKAHKMLLSACSVFFRDLLKANPCQHPIVILPPEVRFADLEKLLRFIYQGEVNVHQENLARFLKTAEMLKIRGLAEDSEKQRVLRSSSPRPPESEDSVSPKRPRLSIDVHQPCQEPQTPNDDNSRLSGNESDSEMIPVKQEMVELKDCSDSAFDAILSWNEDVNRDLAGDDAFIPEAYLREGGSASSSSQQTTQPGPPNAPPPPGPLLPSYVPPPQVKTQDGLSRTPAHPVGGLIRRFLEECLQLSDPGPLLSCYTGLESTPHFQLLRSVAKEWSYCRNATQNYTTMGGSSKRQRATSRLIETFESIDTLRTQLAHYFHQIIILELSKPGTVTKVAKAEQQVQQQQQQLNQQAQAQQQAQEQGVVLEGGNNSNLDGMIMDIAELTGISLENKDHFLKATEVMKQLRKLYFDQSRRLAVRISQLKKGRQQSQERMQRQQAIQQNYLQQTIQQLQQQHQHQQQNPQQQQQNPQQQQQNPQQQQQHQQQHQHQQNQQNQQNQQMAGMQMGQDGAALLHGQLSLHHLHQPWSD